MRKLIYLLALLLTVPCFGQYSKMYYGNAIKPEWNKDGSFTYTVNTPEGQKTFKVDPTTKSKTIYKPSKESNVNVKKRTSYTESKAQKPRIKVIDNNVYLVEGKTQTQLSFDGTTLNAYINRVSYSPDHNYAVVTKKRHTDTRKVTFVESSPANQLQPLVHSNKYAKPGDELDIELPILFNLKEKRIVDLDLKRFENQFNLRQIRWNTDSQRFTFDFNQRGHQCYQIVEVNAVNETIRVVVDETVDTFVFYNNVWSYHLDSRNEILWLSERDGWKHIYMFDSTKDSKVKKQLTKGEWVVRKVLHVDEESEKIYFIASGRNTNENPYYTHLYSVDFKGKNLKELTPEYGNHTIYISPNKKYFVDVYSTPEVEPVSVLRTLASGEKIMNLEKGDASQAEANGWIKPKTFSAKGRDGVTDIWGNIYFPKGYDPSKKYPVVEYIYAGPHNSHVENDFHIDTYYRAGLTDKGYIVVQMDGMGTCNRSKAFHDICWKNLKDAGFPDRILWIKAAAAEYNSMDLDRVGIYGVSAGGQSSTGALLFHNDFYKAAVSACGCHDNRMDKVWWNEQWMGYPIGKAYSESSNVDNAHLLKGRLMLVVGEMDTNVDPASTMQVVDALVKANKYFELLVLPGQGHTLGHAYGMSRLVDFFNRNLKNTPPPFKD